MLHGQKQNRLNLAPSQIPAAPCPGKASKARQEKAWRNPNQPKINFLWAVHQIHHSSEDFTLSTALRLSVFQRLVHFGFYQPLALLGIPKTSVLVHMGFNYLFQFWVHTEVIRKLGPIEWVFCTPSSHRVHHGANKWCLDKNYGSLLIIWDRIFGTFQEEKEDEEIVYGLVEQPQSMNSVWHEVGHWRSEVEERSLEVGGGREVTDGRRWTRGH
ncbi:alkylglycerol monooxygenase-like [Penaeus chinensis]|uniref:alkylglycerol monooxygenase-like n=1 Tax=Penaeus chinensis TaxID=139456 RepID=UPI001FB5EA85|nr:alkylglycerol monooxygenase-like [Penaeus chinensis]